LGPLLRALFVLMDKSAIFVDAGYLLARGGLVVCDTHRRSEFDCAFEPLIGALNGLANDHCQLQPLRLYWYDGSRERIPTRNHLEIGNLPYVKVRLGRIGADGRQKGVDALIYRDLMTLARERAISRAYLISGDEDLREGVVAAQDLGVQVVVVGVRGSESTNTSQSKDLVREADEHLTIDSKFLHDYFSLPKPPLLDKQVDKQDVAGVAASLASEWAEKATPSEIKAVLAQSGIPREIDAQLLRDASRRLSVPRVPGELVADLRMAFRSGLEQATAAGSVSEPAPA
jgi:uncharacterized LabA/DUF88 family protein